MVVELSVVVAVVVENLGVEAPVNPMMLMTVFAAVESLVAEIAPESQLVVVAQASLEATVVKSLEVMLSTAPELGRTFASVK